MLRGSFHPPSSPPRSPSPVRRLARPAGARQRCHPSGYRDFLCWPLPQTGSLFRTAVA